MNKSERINDMLLFLNDKNSFNLKDLIDRYAISKSTALRDIQSLEQIGMPIYSQAGRNGFYGVLPNRLLSPIVFTIDEVYALYFSMLTLNDYETTPFHLSIPKLKSKINNCLSTKKVAMLRKVEKVFRFGTLAPKSHCEFLQDILQSAVDEKVCDISYQKNGTAKSYTVQFFDISSAYGQWYTTGYNFQTSRSQVFRCDRVLSIKEDTKYASKSFSELNQPAEVLYKASDATDFEVMVSERGSDLFQKEHYPSMKLHFEDGNYVIRGFYNKGDEDFIASYFIGYGANILSIQPLALKTLIRTKISELQAHFLSK